MLISKSFPLLSIIGKAKTSWQLGAYCNICCWPPMFLFRSNTCTSSSSCSMQRITRLTTLAASRTTSSISKTPNEGMSLKAKKKARMELPENILKQKLGMCSKHKKIVEALQLYDEARRNGVQLSHDHYNVLLYLCSSAAAGSLLDSENKVDDVKNLGMSRGFEVFQQMNIDKVKPNEATFTNTARLAAAMEDPEMAFDLVKQMKSSGVPPRLRSYGPALFGFCRKGETSRAYEVDAHMIESGVVAGEPELAALLEVSVDNKIGEKVYEMLHRLRSAVRQVSESTAKVIEEWFSSDYAADIGVETWDAAKVNEGIISGGGGWHGQGWLGNGNWRVTGTNMDMKGVCQSCGEKLVCIDIDPAETAQFASSLTQLACQKERMASTAWSI